MTTEQIEQAQVPAFLAGNARIGRVIAAQECVLGNLSEDVEWTASGISDWWNGQAANHAGIGRAGYMAVLQGAAWMLGKIHGVAAELAYQMLDELIGMD